MLRPLAVRVGSATRLLPRIASRLLTRREPLPISMFQKS
jgi:hypothetical protein